MTFRILAIGEVLWDLLPDGKQLGGAAANFAYHVHVRGADARVVSCVGNDPLGREILGDLATLGLPTDGIAVTAAAPTGTVSVAVGPDGQPQFTVHENVAWDHISVTPAALDFAVSVDAIYFGSLAQRCATSRAAIRRLLSRTPSTALRVFDINLRQRFYTREIVEASLTLANALKLNDAELPVLAAMFGLAGDARAQLGALAAQYNLRAIALTRGAHGSLLLADGAWSEHAGVPAKVVDTVGAGDAFTAAWTLGLLAGQPMDEINCCANELAAFVCTQPGATPPLPQEFKECLV